MKLLLGRYAIELNRRRHREGYVFSRPFWSRRLHKPHALRCAVLYTLLNPVAAAICPHPRSYRWCSYRELLAGPDPSSPIDASLLLVSLDERRDVAQRMLTEPIDESVERLLHRREQETWWKVVERASRETLVRG